MAKIPSLIHNGRKLIEGEKNVMFIGKHGTGKTASIYQLAEEMNLNALILSCSTLDPFTDLVGVPVPRVNAAGKDYLQMVRPLALDEADIVFFDELNRARQEVRDAVLEIINNRSINGEPLPRLKACWAAINPPGEEYDVDELDPALMDRFDVFQEFKARPSVRYMSQYVPKEIAAAVIQWWQAHNRAKMPYISPRRLMKIAEIYHLTHDYTTVINTIPPGIEADSAKLWDMLKDATPDSVFADMDEEEIQNVVSGTGAKPPVTVNHMTLKFITDKQAKALKKWYKENPYEIHAHKDFTKGISKYKSAHDIVHKYGTILNNITPNVLDGFFNQCNANKLSAIRAEMRELMKSNKKFVKEELAHVHAALNRASKRSTSTLDAL